MLERAFAEVAGALARRRAGRHLSRGPHHRHGEINPFRPGIERIVDGDAGAGGADGAARAVGQLLQPQGRRGDDEAVPPRAVCADRPRRRAARPRRSRRPPRRCRRRCWRCAATGAEAVGTASGEPWPFYRRADRRGARTHVRRRRLACRRGHRRRSSAGSWRTAPCETTRRDVALERRLEALHAARQTDGAAGSGPAARPRLSRPRQRRPLRPQT